MSSSTHIVAEPLSQVNAIIWGGYPGQSGGTALFDILTGKAAPAGRLPITQYPAVYATQIPMTDMTLRPHAASPGRTYKWYTGVPVFDFGFGLHYTSFKFAWASSAPRTYAIASVMARAQAGGAAFADLAAFDAFPVRVTNTGKVTSDYVALLFASGEHGPAPQPNKELVAYTRVHGVAPGKSAVAALNVTLGALARADAEGKKWLYPGTYTLKLDTTGELTHEFTLTGEAALIADWPKDMTSAQ